MIVEYLSSNGTWEHDHDAAGAGGFTYEAPDLFGRETLREAAVCRLCGAWFTLPDRDQAGLFDNEREELI